MAEFHLHPGCLGKVVSFSHLHPFLPNPFQGVGAHRPHVNGMWGGRASHAEWVRINAKKEEKGIDEEQRAKLCTSTRAIDVLIGDGEQNV